MAIVKNLQSQGRKRLQSITELRSQIDNRRSKIIVVGAGPAGASLSIRLAGAGHEVTLIEKERFPREKLCGEFISPECFIHFSELGVLEQMLSLGGARITETRFFDPSGRCAEVPTGWFGHGDFALSLSRARMDETLLSRARALGVSVIEGSRVVGVESERGLIKSVTAKTECGERFKAGGDIFVDASGRAGALTRLIEKRNDTMRPQKPGLVAFKNHLIDVSIDRDACEIYVFKGGYGGLSPIEEGQANLCFIVGSAVAPKIKASPNSHIDLVASLNKRAAVTLSHAKTRGEWLAVPIRSFGKAGRPTSRNLIPIGDAAAFIDPFTGSGMLMALESSELLARCLRETGIAVDRIAAVYARSHARKFRNRLVASAVLRRAAFMPGLATAAIALTGASEGFRQRLARATRSGSRGLEGRA